jgi:adenylate cyclase
VSSLASLEGSGAPNDGPGGGGGSMTAQNPTAGGWTTPLERPLPELVRARPGEVATEHPLVACLHADVWSHDFRTTDDTGESSRSVTACRDMIAEVIATYGGRVNDVLGNGLLGTFLTVPAAVRCAVEVQHRMRLRNAALPPSQQLQVRIGIEFGRVIVDDGQLHGDCLDVAARVQEVAAPGGVCLSQSAFDRVSPLLLPCRDLGERTVENGERTVRIYQVRAGCGE